MASAPAKVIADNIEATRRRKKLDQADVTERMRALGYTAWHRQTLGKVEREERKLLAAELIGLALALETNIGVLLAVPHDETIDLSSGELSADDATTLAFGRNNGAVRWDGNRPIFGKGVNAWRGEMEDDPARGLE